MPDLQSNFPDPTSVVGFNNHPLDLAEPVGGGTYIWNDTTLKHEHKLIPASSIPSNIDATKIAAGTVDNTEFESLNGVTSSIQTQLDAKQPLDADLTSISALTTTGLLARTAANTWLTRALTAGTGMIITNPGGVAGDPSLSVDEETVSANIQPTGSVSSAGTSTKVARADHVHQDVILQIASIRLALDQTTNSNTFVDLPTLSLPMTTQTGTQVLVLASFASSNTSMVGATNFVRLVYDNPSTTDVGVGQTFPDLANAVQGGSICRLITGLPAGAHTFKLQWRVSTATGQIRPVGSPDGEHASLILIEFRL